MHSTMRHILAGGGVIVAIAVASTFLILYNRPATTQSEAAVSDAKPVSFKEITHGEYSNITTRVNYLITNTSEFDTLWKLLGSKVSKPKVDFSSSIVAAVFAGVQPTDGYSIQVQKIEDADKRTVVVEIVKPDGGCTPKPATTTPYQIVELPQTSLPLAHQDALTAKSCTQ